MGMTLRQIIFEIGGGIPGDNLCKGVLTGQPSGGCIPFSELDVHRLSPWQIKALSWAQDQ